AVPADRSWEQPWQRTTLGSDPPAARHPQGGSRPCRGLGAAREAGAVPAPTTDEPETRADRLRRKTLRGVEILITPRLLREQIEYLRHGPAPEPDGDGSGAEGPAEPAAVEPEPEPDRIEPHFGSSPWARAAVPVTDGPGAQCNVCDW